MKIKDIAKQLERLGHLFFYAVLKIGGQRSGYIILHGVVFTYIVFSRKIHAITRPYITKRFPGQSRFQHFWAVYAIVYSFGTVLIDRAWLGLKSQSKLQGTIIGKEELMQILTSGKGAVLLTAHVGNWQTAMANLDFLPVKVNALMQYDQFAAAKHYFDLGKKNRNFDIIDSSNDFGGMVDAAAALQRGEVVTIMADRYAKGSTKKVDFLGKEVRLPDAAYTLAACVGSPVVIFLAAKTDRRAYELKVWDIFYPQFENRENRQAILQECCQKFATTLELYLNKHPYQWYNFYNFWKQAEE